MEPTSHRKRGLATGSRLLLATVVLSELACFAVIAAIVLLDVDAMDLSRRRREERQAVDVTGLKCADLVDAMGRMHRHRCHILDLVSPTPGRILFGPAVTISYFPSCSAGLDPERYNLANLFYEAVGDEPAGKVIVLASNGYTDTSMGGGTKLLRLQQHGCAGVLTDGRLRDFDELARYDFAAYCSGEATRWGGDRVTPFQANVPVVLDGVGVLPGHTCSPTPPALS